MKTVTPKLSVFAVAALLATLSGPVLAGNVSNTIQEGRMNTNDIYYQKGHINDNAAYQQGGDDANRTQQRGTDNRSQTGQLGGQLGGQIGNFSYTFGFQQ